MDATSANELIALIERNRQGIEQRALALVLKALYGAPGAQESLSNAARSGLQAGISRVIEALLEWVKNPQLERDSSLFAQIVNSSLERGYTTDEVMSIVELTSQAVIEDAKKQFGEGRMLSDSERRLSSGVTVARMMLARATLKKSSS